MGAPLGNQNARKNSEWADALRKEVHRRDEQGVKNLRKLAKAAVRKGIEGDIPALKEIGDRLDGKPIPIIDTGDGNSIALIERVIVAIPNKSPDPIDVTPTEVTESVCLPDK